MGFRFLAYFKIFLSFHGEDFFRFAQQAQKEIFSIWDQGPNPMESNSVRKEI